MRSGLIVIGVLSLVLASCAMIPTPQEANDAVLVLVALTVSYVLPIGLLPIALHLMRLRAR